MRKVNMIQLRRYVVAFMIFTLLIVAGVWIGSSFYHSSKVRAASDSTLHKYYKSIQVEKGDSLWSIAQEYNTYNTKTIKAYIKEVKEINNLDSSTIHEGEYLTVPYVSYDNL